MSILPKIASLLTGKADKIIESVGNTLDSLTTSQEEKEAAKLAIAQEVNRHMEEIGKQTQGETEAYLKDIDSARESNEKIQESDKASWLSKNVAYMIDIFIILVWGAITLYMLAKFLNIIKEDVKADFSGVLGIYSGVTALAVTVLNFHRGSSRGSEKKSDMIEKMQK